MTKRKKYTAEEKAKIALEALKEEKTMNELTKIYGVHATQIQHWKKQLKSEMATIFRTQRNAQETERAALIEQLYQEIGRLKMEKDWLQKKINKL